jgi:hypothetical protein
MEELELVVSTLVYDFRLEEVQSTVSRDCSLTVYVDVCSFLTLSA